MEFKPKYNITDLLLNNITSINRKVVELNNKRFPKPILYKLNTEANYISTHASTSIEGNRMDLTDVRRILKSSKKNIKDTEREILNYNNALIFLNDLIKNENMSLNHRLILKIHRLVTDRLLVGNGKYRKDSVIVNNPLTNNVVYLPPDFKDVKPLMDSLLSFVKNNRLDLDSLILAGIFHKQFVLIHPFMDGNGRACRLLTKVLLAELGLDTFELFSFENYYNLNVSKYFSLVGEYGEYYELQKSIDFTNWLEYFTKGILEEIVRVSDILENKELTPEYILLKDQYRMLEYIKINGYITDTKYSKLTNRAKSTRAVDYNKMIDLGLIERKGGGRSTYYTFRDI